MNLLLVEDDQMLGESICDGARQSGWHIDHVCDAATARGALVDHTYAAVLLDIGLPEIRACPCCDRCAGDTTPRRC